MTTEEKRQKIKDNCINCMFCPLYDKVPLGEYCHREGADIERNYEIMFGKGEASDQPETYIGDRENDSERGREGEEQ